MVRACLKGKPNKKEGGRKEEEQGKLGRGAERSIWTLLHLKEDKRTQGDRKDKES